MKTHYQTETTGPLTVALCGQLGVPVTTDPAAVTCRACTKALAKQAQEGTHAPPDAAQAIVDALAAGEYLGGLSAARGAPAARPAPFAVDRERWRRIMAHCACGSCDVCRHTVALRIEQHTSPYRSRLRARTQASPPRWSSPSAALETYVAHRMDGYPIKAWGGTLELMRDLGAFVQSEGAFSSAAERAAQDVVHVELALRHAFDHDAECLTFGRRDCVAILLACGVGRLERTHDAGRWVQRYVPMDAATVADKYGIRASDVLRIVRVGRARVGELLAERGLVARRSAA